MSELSKKELRQIDALVEEKVMGNRLCRHQLDEAGQVCQYCHLNKSFWWPEWGKIEPPRHYTSNDADAMDAARHALQTWDKKEWKPEFLLTYRIELQPIWRARFGAKYDCYMEPPSWLCSAGAETAAIAICLAALELKGISTTKWWIEK